MNAHILDATIVAVRGDQIWLRSEGEMEGMFRSLLPPGLESTLDHGQDAIVYLAADYAVNGWWALEAQVGVNQRLWETAHGQNLATLTCQGECGRPWICPAPNELLGSYAESCLTCAGDLAP